MSEVLSQRGKVAALTRSRTPDDPELVEARRDLKAAKLAEHVALALVDTPELSLQQRSEIARQLLTAGPQDAA
jgi:hypothetical protein